MRAEKNTRTEFLSNASAYQFFRRIMNLVSLLNFMFMATLLLAVLIKRSDIVLLIVIIALFVVNVVAKHMEFKLHELIFSE